jgi:uncharacterized protein (DUF1697 family)
VTKAVPRYVALLRAVNLGGTNKVPMADLRVLFESLGYTDVSTYIQSGNVIFHCSGQVDGVQLEGAIAGRFRIDTSVVLRTAAELRAVLRSNPFTGPDLSRLHVGFMPRRPSAREVEALDADSFRPEEFEVRRSEVYLHLPSGMARTKLPGYLERRLDVPMTIRNWNTVNSLAELSSS